MEHTERRVALIELLGRDGQVFLSQDAQGQVWVGGDVVRGLKSALRLPGWHRPRTIR